MEKVIPSHGEGEQSTLVRCSLAVARPSAAMLEFVNDEPISLLLTVMVTGGRTGSAHFIHSVRWRCRSSAERQVGVQRSSVDHVCSWYGAV